MFYDTILPLCDRSHRHFESIPFREGSQKDTERRRLGASLEMMLALTFTFFFF